MAAEQTPTPFTINVPQDALDTLHAKLATATLPPPPPPTDDPWHYGVPHADMVRLLDYWKSTYDWRTHEAALNAALPQYTLRVPVQGHGIFNAHFVHQRARRATRRRTLPLLFVHGWPGLFAEVRKVLPLLINPESEDDVAFDVVAPSLPGFGFTDAPEKAGFALDQYAEFAHNLMLALGYNEYVIQGGDWGFSITHRMVHLYGPTHVKAWHTNSPYPRPPVLKWHPWLYLLNLFTPYTAEERTGLKRTQWWSGDGHAYFDIQATTPQTVAYGITDSPVGLLAWLYEKLARWTGDYAWTEDEVLTWVSLYAFSGTLSRASPAASLRIYFEPLHAAPNDLLAVSDPRHYNARVPLGISVFPREVILVPQLWHRTLGPVVYTKRHPEGGHFAAHEQPEALVADVRKMFALPVVQAGFSS